MFAALRFDPIELPTETRELRMQVREFLRAQAESPEIASWADAHSAYAPEFSKKLGERGWIGMMWPKRYGGHERTALDRYVVSEELLAAGAPLAAHWVADRQSGPLILRCGTEDQKQSLVPKIARGELCFCIGMSEPNSGSDLASVQTRANPVDGGWMVNGTKLWTTWAHKAQYMIALVRTSAFEEDRHRGLSQLLIDLKSPGIEVRGIENMSGRHSFNEVVFRDCFVPDTMLLGREGDGWNQVSGELAYERSGPERFLSAFKLCVEIVRAVGPDPSPRQVEVIGRLAAHLMTLRGMALSVAGMLQAGKTPNVEAALVKDLGTVFEQELPDAARSILDTAAVPASQSKLDRTLADALLTVPAFSIQGGTREILRVVIARGIGLK